MDTLISPVTEQKIRSRMVLKNRTHNFKDILRERFKSRIKSNRRSLFNKMRKLNENSVHDSVSKYLQSEMESFCNEKIPVFSSSLTNSDADFTYNEQVMREIMDELLDEQTTWICNEINEEEQQIMTGMQEYLFCPICQKGTLLDKANEMAIVCSICNFYLVCQINSDQLNFKLNDYADHHSTICTQTPQFTLFNEKDLSGLFIICHDCSTFDRVI